jgi:hypothetical protein
MNGVLITLAILCIIGAVAVLMSGVGLIDNILNGRESNFFGVFDIITAILVFAMSLIIILEIATTPSEDDVIRGDATYVETLHLTQQGDTVKTYTLQYVDKNCK